jgi:hypothetical protein
MNACCISVLNSDNSITSIFCQSDGAPEGVGKTLIEEYSNSATVSQLISHGDVKDLGFTPDTCSYYAESMSYAYSRNFYQLEDMMAYYSECGCSWYYLFDNGEWICYESVSGRPSLVDIYAYV